MDDIIRHQADATIWAAIDSKNFKQALKALDKRVAKKPNDLYLQALKFYTEAQAVTWNKKESTEQADLIASLESKVEDGVTFGDEEIVLLYEEALDLILPNTSKSVPIWRSLMGEMRWRQVKEDPKNAELGINNFRICLSRGDLRHAQQIANSLDKNFPKEHHYVFWNIALHHLKHKSLELNGTERSVSGKLSQAMITKLAEATKEARDVKSLPSRAIHTPQESFLLHRILSDTAPGSTAQSTYNERLKFYEDEYLGPESKISKGSWKLWLDKVTLMRQAGHWRELHEFTSKLLPRARKDSSGQILDPRMGDWQVWEAFLSSTIRTFIGDERYSILVSEIRAHLGESSGIDKVYRRNAALAELHATYNYLATTWKPYATIKKPNPGPNGDEEAEEEELDSRQAHCQKIIALLKYLDANRETYSVFEDIKKFISIVPSDTRHEFLIRLARNGKFGIGTLPFEAISQTPSVEKSCEAEYNLMTSGDITACLHKYKLRYLIMSSLSESERKRSKSTKIGNGEFICRWCNKPCGIWCHSCLATLARLSILTYGSALNDDGRIKTTLLPTDTHPADDFAILAAMCLVKLSCHISLHYEIYCLPLDGPRRSNLLRATIILEYAWSHSRSSSRISLLLVRLYAQLGCGSLAMRAFQRLGIKQIQFTTLSYILFDRISSLHPHPFVHLQDDTSRTRSPIEQLEKHQKVYRTFGHQVRRNVFKAFENGNYDSAVQLIEASDKMVSSKVAIMSFIESRKIARILHPEDTVLSQSHGYDLLPQQSTSIANFTDNFDIDSFPNFESEDHGRFIFYTQLGPDLQTDRCLWALITENVSFLIDPKSSAMGQVHIDEWFVSEYPHLRSRINKQLEIWPTLKSAVLSKIEQSAYTVYGSMAEIIYITHTSHTYGIETSETCELANKALRIGLSELLSHVKKVKMGNTVPGFSSTLNPLYVAHEVATMALNFEKFFIAKSEVRFKEQVVANELYLKNARVLMNEVLDRSQKVRRSMNESGWIDKVLDSLLEGDVDEDGPEPSTFAGALKATIDADFMEAWAGDVVESWRDSVMGLACLKDRK